MEYLSHRPPYSMDYINRNQGASPSNIRPTNTALSQYFVRYLLQKTMGVFDAKLDADIKPTGPEGSRTSWPLNYFWYVMYTFGYIAIFRTDIWGTIMQQCTLKGYNIYYQPFQVMVCHPLIKAIDKPLTIGRDCVLVQMTPDYGGIMDLVTYYADLMAIVTEAVVVNLYNSKLAYVFGASGRANAQSLKKMYDEVASGQPATFVDKGLFGPDGTPQWIQFNQNVGGNYITDRLLADLRKIENQYSTAIGLPNANTEKRERLLTDEVNANNVETQSMASVWLDNIKRGFDEANDMFGLDLSIDWRVKPQEQEVENEPATNNDLGRSAGRTANAV